jgi:peptidoglycan/xylan/chitin deacetylase (PgdA/CDA1 family)
MQGNQQYPGISVVIPTRNEAQNLYYILPRMPSIVSEVILIDGHSTDDTIEVAQTLLPTIRIIKQVGKGKGDAVRVGLAACRGQIIVMLDGDGSTDPEEIPRFVEALLDGSDFAKGSRFIKGGGSHDITPMRRLGNYGLCKLVNVLFRIRFSDLCYGYNAFWKHCLDHMDIDCSGFEVETQISLRMRKADMKIVEVPSLEHPRIYGQSNLRTFRDGWRVLKTIVKERVTDVSLQQREHGGILSFSQPKKRKVPILMYHSISDHASPKFRQFTVSPALFAEQMAYLQQHAYTPITVTQFVNALSRGDAVNSSLPERPVILTFDDGFADFFTEAFPVLRKYGFPATLYVATAFIDGTSRWLRREGETSRPMLTWDQLAEISASGIECGAHSHCHPQLDTLAPSQSRLEIVQSKRLLEDHLGKTISSFAYPFGYYTATTRQQVQEAGYTSACTVKHEMSSETSDPFALGRLAVGAVTSVDALSTLLAGPGPLSITTWYLHARTSAWKLIRRSSAFGRRYAQGKLLAR